MKHGLISLISLALTIIVGYKTNVNTGIIGIAVAFILGQFLFGINASEIINGWPTNLFFTLLGITFLFSIAKVNKTLELISKKVCILAKGNTKLLPIIIFIMSGVMAALGPGPIAVTALMAPISMKLAGDENISELLMGTMTISGSLAGGLSPLSPSGIVANTLAMEQGLDTKKTVFLSTFVVMIIMGAIFYIIFGGYKVKRGKINSEKVMDFDLNQKITLIVLLLVIVGILFFDLDIGLTAFLGSTILLLLKVADEKESILGIPWTTLLLVSGLAVLVRVVSIAGGIEVLSNILANIMSKRTASGILAVTSGLMSLVSSASGVVMPTLIPTVPNIVAQVGVSPYALIAGIVVGAHMVTFSPLSTLGALTLASATEKSDKQKLFVQLLTIGISAVIFAGLLGVLGLYDLL